VPFQPTKAILVGVDVLLTVRILITSSTCPCNTSVYQAAIGISASYDALVDLFESIANFLNRLRILTEIPFSPSMSGIITKIMVEVLSVLSLATKQIKQGRLSEWFYIVYLYLVCDVVSEKFAKKLLGESEIEDVLDRLDRLTVDEARMTGIETLQIVHGLVSNMKLIVDGMQTFLYFFSMTDWMLVRVDGRTSMDDIRQVLGTFSLGSVGVRLTASSSNDAKYDK